MRGVFMAVWELEYWYSSGQNVAHDSSVEIWLDGLSDEQFKAVAKELKLLEICGNNLRLPHSKALGRGLFELRERRFGYRIYYTFLVSSIVLLHVGDKTKQDKDIKIARKRLIELLIGENI